LVQQFTAVQIAAIELILLRRMTPLFGAFRCSAGSYNAATSLIGDGTRDRGAVIIGERRSRTRGPTTCKGGTQFRPLSSPVLLSWLLSCRNVLPCCPVCVYAGRRTPQSTPPKKIYKLSSMVLP
jgi:hypothetical protein